MHKWNVYVHSTPSYQPFEYSHKDAKLSKGLPSSNKNIHQMLLVHDSKRCNCNSFVWQSKSDYFFAFTKDSEDIQNWTVRSVMPFFNSLEAILKRTWQLHCTLQKVHEIVHAILNEETSKSSQNGVGDYGVIQMTNQLDSDLRIAYDFHSLFIWNL